MAMTDKNSKFETQLKQQLTASIGRIEHEDISRLNQARHIALSASNTRRFTLPMWSTGVAASFAAIFMIYLSVPTALQPHIDEPLASVALLEQEEIELYEDLDFYEWLEAEQNHG